jgi:hypothetical protein
MIYLIPPVPTQEPKWRIRAEYSGKLTRRASSFILREEVAKIFADKGVPVVPLGHEPCEATEEALVKAMDEIDTRNIKLSRRLLSELKFELLGARSRIQWPQVIIDCRRAAEAVEEAQNRYEEAHQKVMEYAMEQLGLNELTCILVEGPHECIKSPTRQCLYDDEEDPSHDGCLVCGEPEERK